MMAIISDIHGNYPALKEVLAEIDSMGCTTIFSLGDVAGYYCMINECIDLLREHGVVHIMGNHDSYLLNHQPCPRSLSASICLEYQQKNILEKNLNWLRTSPVSLSREGMSMIHGGWNDPLEEYLYEVDRDYFTDIEGEIFLSGHTHIQCLKHLSHKKYCNPGSVGQPRDGDPRAAFAIIADGEIITRRVGYDIDAMGVQMKKEGFDPHYYRNLYQGLKIGEGKPAGDNCFSQKKEKV
jgi:putative phosphoesterase